MTCASQTRLFGSVGSRSHKRELIFALRYMHAGLEDGSDDNNADKYADEEAPADEMASPEMPSYAHPSGCEKPSLGYGRSFGNCFIPVCILLCLRHRRSALRWAFGGASMDEVPGLAVGGAALASPETSCLATATATWNDDGFGTMSPAAIPPRRHGRHRARQGTGHPVPVFPPPPGLDDPPPSPDYSPGPTDDEAKASIDERGGASSSFCSTNDSTLTTTLHFGSTLTVLRAGTTVHPPTSK
ncbi:hypothetical protein CYMTET_55821 [Cymbomonas tetramitiformis]|uniref:Uncharacterized protein n=1 Tax=Cymbomonas tetramitiformis TaxID=36881 RepID=A0AAE0BC77_9CHLO|nr:hypothetical protein CYMTET_55821 [Cymbomonas tetramitiformis]